MSIASDVPAVNRPLTRRERLISDHLNVVHHCAARIHRSTGAAGVPYEDLVAYGCQGLVEAVDKYDPSRGTTFLTFCMPRVRGAILDGVRAFHRISRRVYEHLDGPDIHVSFDAELPRPSDGHSWNGKPFYSPPTCEEQGLSASLLDRLAALPALQRQVLELCYFEGKTLQAAGAQLGMQRSWASRLHARALAALSAALAH